MAFEGIKHIVGGLMDAIATRPRPVSIEQAWSYGRDYGFTAARRHNLPSINPSNYFPAGDVSRLRGDWPTLIQSPVQVTRIDYPRLASRSELAFRTDAIARRVVQLLVTFTIGTGLRPSADVVDDNGEEIEGINEVLDRDWERFNEQGIRTGSLDMTLFDAQQLEFASIVILGNSLSNIIPSRPRSWLPFAFQFVKPTRLDFTRDNYTGQIYEPIPDIPIVHGIKRDGKFFDPAEFYLRGVADPYPASQMAVHYYQIEPEQYLGIPWMAPVLPDIWDAQQFREDKLRQSRLLSLMGIWTGKKSRKDFKAMAQQPNPNDGEDNYWQMLRGGIITSEEKPEAIKISDDLAQAYPALLRSIMGNIGVGMGFSYDLLTSDLEGVNFSGARQNKITNSKFFKKLQSFAAHAMTTTQHGWNKFVEWEVMLGKVPTLNYSSFSKDPHRFTRCKWLPEGEAWVDPLKDVMAMEHERNLGLTTFEEMCGKAGKRASQVLRQLSKEKKLFKQYDLPELIPPGIIAKGQVQGEVIDEGKGGKETVAGTQDDGGNANDKTL